MFMESKRSFSFVSKLVRAHMYRLCVTMDAITCKTLTCRMTMIIVVLLSAPYSSYHCLYVIPSLT